METIISYLQSNQSLSRRKIVSLIKAEKLFLNGVLVESFKQEVKSGDEILISGDSCIVVSLNKKDDVIVLFNKPIGYVVSKSDKHNATIFDILPADMQKLYYIGRLDKDSHGLLLLTNNPAIVHEYEHPSKGIEKTYIVQLDKNIKGTDFPLCLTGIKDEGDLLKAQSVQKINRKGGYFFEVILNEGKKRHIRRMFAGLGYEVLDLQRIKEGEFELGDIKEGEYRFV